MPQLRKGFIHLTNGSTTVKHCYQCLLVSVTGTFDNGDVVTWNGGSDTGVVNTWDANAKILMLYRTAGSQGPEIGDVFVNTSQSGGGTVDTLDSESPPGWNVSIPGLTTPQLITGPHPVYNVSLAGATVDTFELTSAWNEPTEDFLTHGIQTDWTEHGFGLPAMGDVNEPAGISNSFVEVDRRIKLYYATLKLTTPYTFTGTLARIPFDTVEGSDIGGWVQADGTGKYFAVPTGVATVEVVLQFATDVMTPGVSDDNAQALVKKNGGSNYVGNARSYVWTLGAWQAHSGIIPVAAGNDFKAWGMHPKLNDIGGNDQTYFQIRALSLT